jgi:hypothetical protein
VPIATTVAVALPVTVRPLVAPSVSVPLPAVTASVSLSAPAPASASAMLMASPFAVEKASGVLAGVVRAVGTVLTGGLLTAATAI